MPKVPGTPLRIPSGQNQNLNRKERGETQRTRKLLEESAFFLKYPLSKKVSDFKPQHLNTFLTKSL